MKKSIKFILAISVCLFMFVSCMPAGTYPESYNDVKLVQLEKPKDNQEVAVLHTNLGDIKFVLYEEYAPKTVKQFKELVKEGFYNNKECYGIQTETKTMFSGATTEDGKKGKIATENNKPLDVEFSQNLWHFSGAVSAYGEEEGFYNKKIKSDSRFFIMGNRPVDPQILKAMEDYQYPKEVIDAYKNAGGLPTLTGKYTVFGQVIEGMDIVNSVIQSDFKKVDGKDSIKPNKSLIIKKVEIIPYSKNSAKKIA